ncbi:type II toxin-antitoxin system PemK/MazF family toxin [Streptacidiphilus sp. 4-A2]|nr:type II toxin-antitoxin system PemK/MazF family toxin [Streptacidiphilus sp. 4-A2]
MRLRAGASRRGAGGRSGTRRSVGQYPHDSRSPAHRTFRSAGRRSGRRRAVVVVQASAYEHLSTWIVVPTTTKSFDSLIHPTIELLGQEVRVLVEQATAIDPQRLGDFAGCLSTGELMKVNEALRAVLDLE